MNSKLLKSILVLLTIFYYYNIQGQNLGKGSVSIPNYNINGVNFNISGDLNVRFVFIDNQPEVKLNWNWVKVNYITYKGVRYDSSNNPFKGNFDYIKSGFNGKVEVTMVAPTVNEIQKETRTVVSGIGSTSFVFTINKNIWEDYSFTERGEIKKKWKEQNHPLGVKLLSIDGIDFINMASSVKSHWSKLQKEKESKNNTANTTNTSSKEKTENKTAEVKKELNERKEKKSEIKKTNTSNAYSRLSPSDKEKLRQISLQRRSTYQKLQDNFNYTNQITNNLINTINHYENQARKRQEERRRKDEQEKIARERYEQKMNEMRSRQNRLYSNENKRVSGISSQLINYAEDVGTLEDVINLAIEKNINEVYVSSVEIRIIDINSFKNTTHYWQGDEPLNTKRYGDTKPITITYNIVPQKIKIDNEIVKNKKEILKYFESLNCNNCYGNGYSLYNAIIAGFDKYSVSSALQYYAEILNSDYSKTEIKNNKQDVINSNSLKKIIAKNTKEEKDKNIIKTFEQRILTETFSFSTTGKISSLKPIRYSEKSRIEVFISQGKYIKIIKEENYIPRYNVFNVKTFKVEAFKSIKFTGYNFNRLASMKYYQDLNVLSSKRQNTTGFNNRFDKIQPTANQDILINKDYFGVYSKYKIDKKFQDKYIGHYLAGPNWMCDLCNMIYIEHGYISNKDGKILFKPTSKVEFTPAFEVKGTFFKQKKVDKSLYERVFKTTYINSGLYPEHNIYNSRELPDFYKVGNTLISSYNIDKFNTSNSKPIRIYNLKGNLLTLKPSQNKSDFSTLFNLLNYKNISHLPYDFDM